MNFYERFVARFGERLKSESIRVFLEDLEAEVRLSILVYILVSLLTGFIAGWIANAVLG
jgi:hypothetical protein